MSDNLRRDWRTRQPGNRPGRPRKSLLSHYADLSVEFGDPEIKTVRGPRIPPADLDRKQSVYLPDPEWDAKQAAHWVELGEMAAMGWGDTPQKLIPADWRTTRGPDTELQKTPEQIADRAKRTEAQRAKRTRSRHALNAYDKLESCPTSPSPNQVA